MIGAVRRRREDANEAEPGHADALRLDSLVRESREAGIERRVLILRLSMLPRHLAQPHHLRLARDALAPLTGADRARVFALPNEDIAVVWRGDASALLVASLDAVRLLFEDDALPDPSVLAQVLRLPADADVVLAAVGEAMAPPLAPLSPQRPLGKPLDLQTLHALESALARADVARLARRRAVTGPDGAGGFDLRWELRLLSVAELADALVPGTDVLAEPWLFRRLTRTLDRRMLALLAAPDELRGAGPFGLCLNVSSLLAPEFLRFDSALPVGLRGQVTLCLAADDMLLDPAAFTFARDFANARQYRLLLRGVAASQVAALPLRRTGMDLLELCWSPDVPTLPPNAVDARRTLLSGVDTAEALAWAEQAGIALLSGRLAQPTRRRG